MNGHTVHSYLDGFVRVRYCRNCGKEGTELVYECQSVESEKYQLSFNFDVDNKSEHS